MHCSLQVVQCLIATSVGSVQLGTKPLECPGPTAEDKQTWLAGLRVPAGRSRSDKRYLRPSHIETAKSAERRDDYYTFHEVLYALCERRAGRSMPPSNEEVDTLRVRASPLPARFTGRVCVLSTRLHSTRVYGLIANAQPLQIKLSLMMPTLRLETIDEITQDQKRKKAEKRAEIFNAMQNAAASKGS